LLCLILLSFGLFHLEPSKAKNQSSNEAFAAQSPQYGTGQAMRLISDATGSASNIEPVGPVATNIFSSAGQGRVQGTDEAFARLIIKAKSEGPVRVIVGLNTAFRPEGLLPNAQQVESQREGITQAQDSLIAHLTGFNTSAITRFTFIPFIAMELDEAGLTFLQNSPEVSSITEDLPIPLALAESVPLIGGTAAWASGFSGTGQTVAILDSGVDKTHSFLSAKVVSEACYSTTGAGFTSVCPGGVTESTSPGSGVNCSVSMNSDCAHGTHVAGIAAGKGSSFSGVAKDANIISIQVFSQPVTGGRLGAFDSDMIKGLQRVQELSGSFNVAAVNMSIGGGLFTTNCNGTNPAMKAAIDNLRSIGIATVIASGNDGSTNGISYPACISSAISVGSTDDGSLGTTVNAVSGFSNSASFLKLLAPGRWINSSIPGGGFQNFSGTSMATPHVAGAWAVLKSKTPAATVDQVLQALTSTGLSITDSRNGITKPRIKVDAAVNALEPPPPIRTLTVASTNPSSGVSISVNPADNNGSGDGTTQFSRTYTNNIEVSLAAPAVAGGNTNFQKWQRNGVDWSTSQLTSVVMDANYTMTAVYGPATGPNVATYDSILKAPKCGQPGNSCDSGTLLNGRGNISGGPEPNQPNTINNSCSDGSLGTYHVDESIDRIRVATTDGSTLAPGKLATFEITYWASSTTSDFLDLFYLSDANSSDWTYVTTLRPQATGLQVVSAIRNLAGTGNLQVVRAILHSGPSIASCNPGTVNDHDDLVFAAPAPPPTLMVESANPVSGVNITVSPNDNNGQGNGATQFTRIYNYNTLVTLTAPATVGGQVFSRWRLNGFDMTSSLSASVNVVPFTTMTAVYVTPQKTLTVASANPASGVTIAVNPVSSSGSGDGITQFRRTYNQNTTVTLTAPPTAGGNNFQKWQRNGADWSFNPATDVTLDADYTMTAVYATPPPPQQTLTVASVNPASGVSITVSPNDNSGSGNGITQFTRTYNQNTTVTLTAPATAGGNNFQKWQRSGADWSTSQTTNVMLDADYTMTAVYVPQQTLTVGSNSPGSGVTITVSPTDNNGLGNGTTLFTRTYNQNTTVTLTAPATAGGNNFQKWFRNGVTWSFNQTTTVTMDANYTMTAAFVTPPQQTLTVASVNPASGVNITVSPNDNNGSGNGITQFTRTYNQNTTVTLTAPATAGGNNFQKWQRSGADWSTSQTTNVTLDANYTMTAVFVDPTSAVNVQWKNVINLTASGNSLTKPTNGNVAWDAGAVSTKAIASGDGYMEFTASENTTNRMCGLSNGDSNQDYSDIDFAIYLYSDGTAYIFEGGINKAILGAYALNDVFRVAVESGVVKYRKNGAVLYTSTVTPTYPLLVDTAISIPGGTINNVKLSGTLIENVLQWTNAVNVTVSGNSLTKQGGGVAVWDAGAVSSQTITAGDGYVEFTVLETNKNRMCGLSNGDSNQNYADIDFAWYAYDDGTLYVFEDGVNRGSFGSFTTGDRLRVAVEGGVVKYRKNGMLLYTSATAPTYPLLVDTAFSAMGATISDAVIGGGTIAGTPAKIDWLAMDHLGTPRMIVDQTGTLANVKRHDYLPFSEEQFTSKERDIETRLDYFLTRYYSSTQDRFTSVN